MDVPESQLSATEEELRSQWSATEEDFQSQRLATDDELQSQQSATEERVEVAILQESFLLINIWSRGSLKQGLRNLMACFKEINHPIQCVTARIPNSSHSSSPRHFEYTYGVASVNGKNSDQHHQFKSLLLLDMGGIHLIDHSSLLQLEEMIRKQSGKPGYQQIMRKIFDDNSYVLDRFFCDLFNSAGLSIDTWTYMDDSQFTYESANRCVMNLKVTAGLLCFMLSELDEAECVSFHPDLKNYYFTLCARRPIDNLIEAAKSISSLNWSASQVYQMLVLYEAIVDVLGAIGNPNESAIVFEQMRVNFEGVFVGMQSFICANLNGSSCAITRVRHPVTDFLVQSMELFKNHSIIVQHYVGGGTSSLGQLFSKVISCWAEELKKHSVSYAEGRDYVFLLNNLTYFILEIEKLQQVLTPNSEHGNILELLELLIKKYTSKYLKKCWRPVRNCVKLDSGRKPCLSSLNAFTSQFNAICNCQRTWVLQTQLKKNLRGEIRKYITPTYDTFLEELQKRRLLRARLFCQNLRAGQQAKHMTTQEVISIVEGLFESEYIE